MSCTHGVPGLVIILSTIIVVVEAPSPRCLLHMYRGALEDAAAAAC